MNIYNTQPYSPASDIKPNYPQVGRLRYAYSKAFKHSPIISNNLGSGEERETIFMPDYMSDPSETFRQGERPSLGRPGCTFLFLLFLLKFPATSQGYFLLGFSQATRMSLGMFSWLLTVYLVSLLVNFTWWYRTFGLPLNGWRTFWGYQG